jgi:predicted phage tail protein
MKSIKQVKIHGLLSTYFGNFIKLTICNIKQLIYALDCIKPGFRKKINELLKDGYSYSIVEDKDEKCIHLIPSICGSGKTGMYIVGAVLIVIGIVLCFIPGAQFLGYSSLQWGLYFFIPLGMSTIISAASIKETKFSTSEPVQQYQAIKGITSSSETETRSFSFENEKNMASQGSSIPIGYGSFKIGSQIISNSVLAFDVNLTFLSQSEIDYLSPPWFDYLAN